MTARHFFRINSSKTCFWTIPKRILDISWTVLEHFSWMELVQEMLKCTDPLHDYKMLDKLVCSYQNPVFVPPVNNNCWATDLNMRALTILKLASMRRHAPGQEPCVVQSECNLVFVNHWVKSNRCYHSKDKLQSGWDFPKAGHSLIFLQCCAEISCASILWRKIFRVRRIG